MDISKIRQIAEPVVSSLGLELIEARFLTEHGKPTLRLAVEKVNAAGVGSVTVGDCQKVSRELETLLAVEGLWEKHYSLSVSSPGLDRPLVKESDFEKFAGRVVSMRTNEPIDGRRNYKGRLIGLQDHQAVVNVDGTEFRIPLPLIQRAHLVY